MDPSVFSSCQNEFPDENSTVILGCVAESLERISNVSAENLQDFLLVVSGAMIFFMQTGFAVLCAGAVRIKNVQNTMLKNLLDACGAAMAFYMLGKWTQLETTRTEGAPVCFFLFDAFSHFCNDCHQDSALLMVAKVMMSRVPLSSGRATSFQRVLDHPFGSINTLFRRRRSQS